MQLHNSRKQTFSEMPFRLRWSKIHSCLSRLSLMSYLGLYHHSTFSINADLKLSSSGIWQKTVGMMRMHGSRSCVINYIWISIFPVTSDYAAICGYELRNAQTCTEWNNAKHSVETQHVVLFVLYCTSTVHTGDSIACSTHVYSGQHWELTSFLLPTALCR